jgi:hypothetical protein
MRIVAGVRIPDDQLFTYGPSWDLPNHHCGLSLPVAGWHDALHVLPSVAVVVVTPRRGGSSAAVLLLNTPSAAGVDTFSSAVALQY